MGYSLAFKPRARTLSPVGRGPRRAKRVRGEGAPHAQSSPHPVVRFAIKLAAELEYQIRNLFQNTDSVCHGQPSVWLPVRMSGARSHGQAAQTDAPPARGTHV